MSSLEGTPAKEDEGESFDVRGVPPAVGKRDEVGAAPGLELKTDEAELASELVESTVPGISGESVSSTRACAGIRDWAARSSGCVLASGRRAMPFVRPSDAAAGSSKEPSPP